MENLIIKPTIGAPFLYQSSIATSKEIILLVLLTLFIIGLIIIGLGD